MDTPEKERQGRLKELALLFLRLGATAFGGPAAQIAIMHDETVRRKKWLDDKGFLDLIGAVNLIPGPNSTEVAIHVGYLRAGWRGLVTAGACFIIPAAVIVTALTWVYVRYGSTPEGDHIFYGIKPVIIAVILQALYFLGSKAVREPVTILTGVAVAAAYLIGVNEIALLFGGGLFVMLWKNAGRLRGGNLAAFILPLTGIDTAAAEAKGATLASIFLVFLKIGSVLYGSGYVLLAFLNSDFVEHRGWL
ncbi:MAG: chromate efflux transporter, partial [Thermodesulfobacteriota bacterium]